jgi:pimeloyl-ACP methyl ester carboxylesterase
VPGREFAVDVAGGSIVGWEHGDGVPALVLHGGPLSDYMAPLAELLPEGVRAIRYQQRGLPPSTLAEPLGVEAHVADAIAVLDAQGIEQAWAIGHSWGGHLAFHVAAAHPERLLGVVGVDALGAVPDGGWGDMDANLFARLAAHSPDAAARAKELDERAVAGEATEADLRESLGLIWPYYFASPDAAPPMPDLRISVPLYSAVVTSVFEHFERGTLERALPSFSRPFALIHGVADPLPLDASRATAALVPHSMLVPIEDAGHFSWLEQPDSVRAALDRVLPDEPVTVWLSRR